jgi:hypothetical protein
MTAAWIAVAVIGAATIALKAAGTVVLAGRELPPRFDGVVALLAPTLLAALVVVQTLEGDGIAVDARVAGLAAAGVALLLRAPLLVVLAAAAGVAAAARALGAA